MERLTDEELKHIYRECESIIDGAMKSHYQNEEILTCYNAIKEMAKNQLTYTMVVYVYEKATIEMADRFYCNDIINRRVILDYLEEELNNISQPKENKYIPTEARVGSILTIKTMMQFIKSQ